MDTRSQTQRALLMASVLLSMGLLARTANAAQVGIADYPLFLGSSAPANIMLLVDDSGSMDWGTVTPEDGGLMTVNGCRLAYTHPTPQNDNYRDPSDDSTTATGGDRIMYDYDSYFPVPPEEARPGLGFWRARNKDYNALYYDPAVTYRPWKGNDNLGIAFGNASPTAARIDPYTPTLPGAFNPGGSTFNLTVNTVYHSHDGFGCQRPDGDLNAAEVSYYPARYWRWSDSNGNGLVDIADGKVLVEIRATTPTYSGDGRTARSDCAGAASGVCTYAEEIQNFANWFQYYRRRELTAKAAFGTVVNDVPGARMGLATLHNNNNANIAIRSLNIGGNRNTLLGQIYSINSDRGTPLLDAVNNCGLYLNCGGTSNSTSPGSSFNDNRNPYGFRHDGTRDDIDNDGTSDTLAAGCPALSASKGGACQQNYLIAMTDGYYNTSNPNVGEYDSDGNSPDSAGNTIYDGGAYASSVSNTLADITMRFYERDIQPNLADNVPANPGIDMANHQHMVSFMVAFGLDGTITPNTPGTDATGMPANPATPFNWPNPGNLGDNNPEKLDDLRHAAYNGRGLYLSAKRPQELIASLLAVVENIAARVSSASSVALNSGSLNTGTRIFQARFDSADWTGELRAFPVSSGIAGAGNGCTVERLGELCPQSWNAGTVLNGQNWDTGRKIISRNSSTKTGIAFRWSALHSSQQAKLCDNPDTNLIVEPCIGADLTKGQARLEYLRGSRANEEPAGHRFRKRQRVLGDLVNSDPFYVGPPSAPYELLPSIGAAYNSFRNTYKNRTPLVFVGANDGMLHAFNADTGAEVMAYVPSEDYVFDKLGLLSSQFYAAKHKFFVDGSPTAGDAYFDVDGDGTAKTNAWRSVLVGSLRAGGQGIFALDITDPSQFSEANAASTVLWEFSHKDDKDLGFTYSRPSIVQMQNGKWAVVIGNGYNNSCFNIASICSLETASTYASTTGKAYLFIIYLDGPGSNGVWDLGTEYVKLEVNAGTTLKPNGLATPSAVDVNGDFRVDYIYAGDLEGNMWRFNVNSPTQGAWAVGKGGNPIFRACSGSPCSNANRQPITGKPDIGPHPGGPPVDGSGMLTGNGLLVYFGTGRYIAVTDRNPGDIQNQVDASNTSAERAIASSQTQSFYAVWDTLDNATTVHERSSLTQQSITQEINNDGGACTIERPDCYRLTSNNRVYIDTLPLFDENGNGNTNEGNDRPAGTRGWYMNLINTEGGNTNNQGERQVSDPVLRMGRLMFTTLLPNPNQCEFGGGGWLMELDPYTGARMALPPFDVNNDGVVDANDEIKIRANNGDVIATVIPGGVRSKVGIVPRPTILDVPDGGTDIKFMGGSLGSIQGVLNKKGGKSGRLTWRQIR